MPVSEFASKKKQKERPMLPPIPPSPKKDVAKPYKRPKFRVEDLSGGAWPTDSEYEDPSPEYLARATVGPIGDKEETKKRVQSNFNKKYTQYIDDTKAAEKRARRRMDSKFSLK